MVDSRVPCSDGAGRASFDDGDPLSAAGEQDRRHQSGDAGADHGHLGVGRIGGGALVVLGAVEPQ
jgi:hypothetical protein